MTRNKHQVPEDVASKRLRIISPLLDETLDPAKLIERKKKISEESGLSYRSISRYYAAYCQNGFAGIKPKQGYQRKDTSLPTHFPDVVEQAVLLRRECPSRSVSDIIRILELEGAITPGSVHRSTLQRYLQAAGFGAKHIRLYTQKGLTARRFAKPHRMMLLQGDIKYGPHLPIGKNGAMQQVYLSSFIDDATRYMVSAKFYDNQRVEILEDSLREAIMRYGKPDKIYVDNGKQYRSDWLKKACNRLGIILLHSRPFHAEGKGKIEAFNRRMDAFLAEVALNKPKTLEALNEALALWVEEYYHKNIHSALDGLTPEVAFKSDKRALRFVSAEELRDAFLHTESRQVDKTGCIHLNGKTYDVGMKLIGRKVDVRFDPTWTDKVEIHGKDFFPFLAAIQVIGENCGYQTELPLALTPVEATESRLLSGLKQNKSRRRTHDTTAIQFRNLGGPPHV